MISSCPPKGFRRFVLRCTPHKRGGNISIRGFVRLFMPFKFIIFHTASIPWILMAIPLCLWITVAQ
jgi:hypothetical protein